VLGIMADIVCAHFPPEQIVQEANATGLPPKDQELLGPALAVLMSPAAMRAYRVDVETDSTIQPNEDEERTAATELLTNITTYMQANMPLLQQVAMVAPQAAPAFAEMVGGMLAMAVRKYRGGEDVEMLIENAMQALIEPPQGQPAPVEPPPPDPAAEAAAMQAQADAQLRAAELQMRERLEMAKLQATQQTEAAKLELQRELETLKMAQADRHHNEKLNTEREKFAVDVQVRQAEGQASRDFERERAEVARPQPDPRIDQLAETVGGIASMLEGAADRLEAVAQEIAAPVEIMRGPDGRAVGVRRGNRERTIARGADGRATGLN
jgi:hypothetical protein